MENKFVKHLKELVLRELENEEVKIFLFGSRAREDNNVTSDVDIGILPHGTIDKKKTCIFKRENK